MDFVFYFLLRRLYISLDISGQTIMLRKGIFFKRIHSLTFASVVRITVRRSLIMRILRIKQIELYTRGHRFKLFARESERLGFPAELPWQLGHPKRPIHFIRPRFGELAFGTLIDVRALGAIAVFAAVMRRVGTVFGGKYLDNVLSLLDTAAVNVEQAFSAMRVYVPRIAAALAVFALAAWLFAYARKLLALARFSVGRSGSVIIVTSGLITLYEHMLVPNSAAMIICDSPISLLAKRAPIYLRGVMVFPSVSRKNAAKVVHILNGARLGKAPKVRPPKRAWFGFCAAPLWWSAGFAAAIALMYVLKPAYPTELIKTVLYCGLLVSVYTAAVYLYYMRYSGIASENGVCRISARRTTRLYTAVFTNSTVSVRCLSQNLFQRRGGLCDLRIGTEEPRSFKVRLIPLDKLEGQY